MSKGNKPTPPPLDEGEQTAAANSDIPQAESGKATAEDAARAAARTTPAPASPEVTAAANELAGGKAIAALAVDVDAAPGAVISQRAGQFVARPDPTRPLSTTEAVVHGNWVGRYHDDDGAPCPAYVKHGTPLGALPRDLAQAVVETRGQVVGPLPPKQPQNPFTP